MEQSNNMKPLIRVLEKKSLQDRKWKMKHIENETIL